MTENTSVVSVPDFKLNNGSLVVERVQLGEKFYDIEVILRGEDGAVVDLANQTPIMAVVAGEVARFANTFFKKEFTVDYTTDPKSLKVNGATADPNGKLANEVATIYRTLTAPGRLGSGESGQGLTPQGLTPIVSSTVAALPLIRSATASANQNVVLGLFPVLPVDEGSEAGEQVPKDEAEILNAGQPGEGYEGVEETLHDVGVDVDCSSDSEEEDDEEGVQTPLPRSSVHQLPVTPPNGAATESEVDVVGGSPKPKTPTNGSVNKGGFLKQQNKDNANKAVGALQEEQRGRAEEIVKDRDAKLAENVVKILANAASPPK